MRLLAILSLSLLASACASYRFAKTDSNFTAVPKTAAPLVCLHETPPAFRSVGVIEWDGPQDVDPDELRAEVAKAGQKVGCDVVMSMELMASRVLAPGVVLAQHEGHGGHGGDAPRGGGSDGATTRGGGNSTDTPRGSATGGGSRDIVPTKTFRFHCGVLAPAGA